MHEGKFDDNDYMMPNQNRSNLHDNAACSLPGPRGDQDSNRFIEEDVNRSIEQLSEHLEEQDLEEKKFRLQLEIECKKRNLLRMKEEWNSMANQCETPQHASLSTRIKP